MAEREAFLKRWSRRKAEPVGEAEEAPQAKEEEKPGRDDKAGAETPNLPDVESLSRESDYSVFLQKGVPSALRKQALRKLWRLDPAFSELDGLVEYGEDYSAKAFGAGAAQAAQEIGRRVARAESDSPDAHQHDEPEADEGADAEEEEPSRETQESSRES